MNHSRMGLKFPAGVWNLQFRIYTRPLKLTCFITFDFDIWIVHEFDKGLQDARFEVIVSHVVAITYTIGRIIVLL